MRYARLTKRREFVTLNKSGRSQVTPAFVLLAHPSPTPNTTRIGYTASRKVGNAVHRNRAKRRMRAVFDAVLRLNPTPPNTKEWDFVMIARHKVFERDFEKMCRDFKTAVEAFEHDPVDTQN